MQFHIHCEAEEIARYAFVPGSHERARLMAAHLQDARLVSDSRGYLVYTGSYSGVRMTVSSTGMGGPTTAICIEELGRMGADTFIRVGSCGVFQDNATVGDVIVSTGTYRDGGTANGYLPIEFPAVANFYVTTALVEAAAALNLPVQVGLGTAGDAFYAPRDPAKREMLKTAGVLSVEMESDTLYIVAALRGWRAGALYTSDGTNKETKPVWGEAAYRQGEQNSIRIALEGMFRLARTDGA
jgi:uridine phosphorylase